MLIMNVLLLFSTRNFKIKNKINSILTICIPNDKLIEENESYKKIRENNKIIRPLFTQIDYIRPLTYWI